MARGGPRNRSGPAPDPASARSDARGIEMLALPAAGYRGRAPKWPLGEPTDREKAVWREVWKTPQATEWAKQRLWRTRTVGLFVRWSVRAESGDSTAAVLTQVNRLADQLGLTPAGMRENGWRIAAVVREPSTNATTPAPAQARRPLTIIDGGA